MANFRLLFVCKGYLVAMLASNPLDCNERRLHGGVLILDKRRQQVQTPVHVIVFEHVIDSLINWGFAVIYQHIYLVAMP